MFKTHFNIFFGELSLYVLCPCSTWFLALCFFLSVLHVSAILVPHPYCAVLRFPPSVVFAIICGGFLLCKHSCSFSMCWSSPDIVTGASPVRVREDLPHRLPELAWLPVPQQAHLPSTSTPECAGGGAAATPSQGLPHSKVRFLPRDFCHHPLPNSVLLLVPLLSQVRLSVSAPDLMPCSKEVWSRPRVFFFFFSFFKGVTALF